jgi:DNA-binding transcriptional LysR family regulator
MSAAEASGRHATSKRSMRPFSSRRINSFPTTVIPSHTMVKDTATSWFDASVRLTWMLSIVSSRPERTFTTASFPSNGSGRVQLLYNEEFVCVLANAHPYKGKTLTIKKYLELKHVVIETQPGEQTLVDRALTEGGYRRNSWLQLPYFIAAIAALQDTDYVLTCPSRLAKQMLSRYALHSIKAPPEIPAFSYFMFWHPRLEGENLHSWFREFILDSRAKELGDPKR